MAQVTKRWMPGWITVVLLGGVLSLYRLSAAAPPEPQQGQLPFRNPVAQREEMIRELQEIKTLLKEQNALLQKMANAR